MSADLLAEFGTPEPTTAKSGQNALQLGGTQAQKEKDMIPDVRDIFSETTAGENRDKNTSEQLWHRDEAGVDVLFDASADRDMADEEFGDFEGEEGREGQNSHLELQHDAASEQNPSISSKAGQSLIDLETATSPSRSPRGDELPAEDDEWGDFSTAASEGSHTAEDLSQAPAPSRPRPAPILPKGLQKQEIEPEMAHKVGKASRSREPPLPSVACYRAQNDPQSNEGQEEQVHKAVSNLVAPSDEIRPSYIPPPVVLLQILPMVFDNLAKDAQQRQVTQFSDNILSTGRVAGRLIAGRILRWKRDTILSQSMKIGPAAAGRRGGGMKLTGMNKSESLKEEREVGDALQAWDRHAQLFGSTVSKAGARQSVMRLSDQMRPRPANGIGSMTSPRPCALCGLKREEKVPGIDFKVEDSFGEYWVEHWGHLDCKKFWQSNQALLPQR